MLEVIESNSGHANKRDVFIDISIVLKFRRLIAFTERNGAEGSFCACDYFQC